MSKLVFWNVMWGLGMEVVLASIVATIAYVILRKQLRLRVERMFYDTYSENLWEGVTALKHVGLEQTVENELRAASAKVLHKPLGSSRKFPHFEGLLFIPRQLATLPTEDDTPVDTRTTLGPKALRPLTLSMPIMVSAMGYGVALSKPFSLAIAQGSGFAATAFNTGQGPVLQEHRDVGKRMIVQYHGGFWRPTEEQLGMADMIEIRFGQGANAGAGTSVTPADLPADVLSDFMQYASGAVDNLVVPAGLPEVRTGKDLTELVTKLRKIGKGVPIAVKFSASHDLERDIELAVQADVDIIVLDGAQGGTHGSPAILVDDFGLPTLTALCRAERYLQQTHCRKDLSLVVSGRIRTPGDILKALALGADAVYLGSAALFATAHTQILKPLPFEPPTQIAFSTGKYSSDFNIQEGAVSLGNFLVSSNEELKAGVRALGKKSVHDVNRTDLVAWDKEVARVTEVPLV